MGQFSTSSFIPIQYQELFRKLIHGVETYIAPKDEKGQTKKKNYLFKSSWLRHSLGITLCLPFGCFFLPFVAWITPILIFFILVSDFIFLIFFTMREQHRLHEFPLRNILPLSSPELHVRQLLLGCLFHLTIKLVRVKFWGLKS